MDALYYNLVGGLEMFGTMDFFYVFQKYWEVHHPN